MRAGKAYSTEHKGTDHLWAMEALANGMISEIRTSTYPRRGVTVLSACRDIPVYPDRPDKWW